MSRKPDRKHHDRIHVHDRESDTCVTCIGTCTCLLNADGPAQGQCDTYNIVVYDALIS